MLIRYVVVAITLGVLTVEPAQVRAQGAAASADPMITIDGTKNPELIPQWSVWGSAFRYLAMAKDDLEKAPTAVLRALTREQSVALVKEATAAESFDQECGQRAVQVGRALLAEKPDLHLELANSKVVEASMPCRRHTLDVRNRCLALMSPAGAAALSGWVESLKVGWTTTLRKSHLKAYRLPE